MSDIKQAGRYLGRLTEWKVDRSKNGCVQFIARAKVDQVYDPIIETYQTMIEEQSINAFLTLTTLAGGINNYQVDALKSALGWSGESLKDLHIGPWHDVQISLVVEEDDVGGRMKVSWINHAGGFKKIAEEDLDQMDLDWQKIVDPNTEPALKKESTEECPF